VMYGANGVPARESWGSFFQRLFVYRETNG
jgi:hypothetical protein